MDLDTELDILLNCDLPTSVCRVRSVLHNMPEEQKIKLEALLDAEIVSAAKIAFVLSKNGFQVTNKSISRHRRRFRGGGCSCP
jgi:hypothetical protein